MFLIDHEAEVCKHKSLPEVPFDPELARTMSSTEVRIFFPRLTHKCPECGETVIKYASQEHYEAGDW